MQRVWGAQFFILALLFRRVVCDAQCFGVGGQKSSAAPCNSDVTGLNGSHSACCDESKQEACLSTGLCYATQRTDNITFWAEGCTDPSGLDPSCPQVCGTTSQFITGQLRMSTQLSTDCNTNAHARTPTTDVHNALLWLQLVVLLLQQFWETMRYLRLLLQELYSRARPWASSAPVR